MDQIPGESAFSAVARFVAIFAATLYAGMTVQRAYTFELQR